MLLTAMEKYYPLTEACRQDLLQIVRTRRIPKHTFFLQLGEVPVTVALVTKGLFSYYTLAENGDMLIKKFFAEGAFMAATAALIAKQPSRFSIYALEDSEVILYKDEDFRRLMHKHPELAFWQICYLEKNWVVDKEQLEISLKYETAALRYQKFLQEYGAILPRLKQHHIASFLGITPTQLSRIRRKNQEFR